MSLRASGDASHRDVDESTLEEAPLTEAEEQWILNQKRLGDAAAIAENKYADDFAYGYFSEDGLKFVIGFRESAPDEVTTAFKATNLPFSIEENVGFNAADRHRIVDSIGVHLKPPASSKAWVGISSAPDLGRFVLEVVVQSDGPADVERIAQITLPNGYSIVSSVSYL